MHRIFVPDIVRPLGHQNKKPWVNACTRIQQFRKPFLQLFDQVDNMIAPIQGQSFIRQQKHNGFNRPADLDSSVHGQISANLIRSSPCVVKARVITEDQLP